MTEKKQRAMALAAASVLGLSLGMVALNADAEQTKQSTSNQIKNGSTQIKTTTGYIKHNTISNQDKHVTGGSDQHKIDAVSSQHKIQTPSPALNPQPEPPKPVHPDPTGTTPH